MTFDSIERLRTERAASGRPYLEFLRIPALSCGVYVLPAGGVDRQKPHQEDEIYYAVSGAASMTVGSQERAVRQGDVIFVPAGVDHRFHSITEELTVLVVFGPAETI